MSQEHAQPTEEPPQSTNKPVTVAKWAMLGIFVLGLGLAAYFATHGEKAPVAADVNIDVPKLEGKTIIVSDKFKERAKISTEVATKSTLTPVITVVGTVTFDPSYVATVTTRVSGVIRKLHHIEGDDVKEGEILAEVESTELATAQAQVSVVKAQKYAAELNATREADLAAKKLSTAREAEVAQASLNEAQALLRAASKRVAALSGDANSPFGTYQLRAPLAGTVVERHVHKGQAVSENTFAFRVAFLEKLWVELEVFEKSIEGIKEGDEVELSPVGSSMEAVKGKVAHVGAVLDSNTRSTTVRVTLPNVNRRLRPGQAVSAQIRPAMMSSEVISVPKSAVSYVDGKPTVFIAETNNRLVATLVELGREDANRREIKAGVNAGQMVVVDGVFALKSEMFR